MNKSEKIYEEIQRLIEKQENFKEEEGRGIEDIKEDVLTLLSAQMILEPNDARIKEFNEKIEMRKNPILEKRNNYWSEYSRVCKELVFYTAPIIREGRQKLYSLQSSFKIKREILSKKYEGFNNRTLITYLSNEDEVSKGKKIIAGGIERLEGMHYRPVSEIQDFIKKTITNVQAIDVDRMHQKEADENDYFRFESPKGYTVGTESFAGPRSGLV
jgi:hypothetical protein